MNLLIYLDYVSSQTVFYHVTYAFQSESTLYSCLNVKELLTRNRCDIWCLSDNNGIRTKWALNDWVFLYELSGCEFKSRCCNLPTQTSSSWVKVLVLTQGLHKSRLGQYGCKTSISCRFVNCFYRHDL